jgi:hypothetical protein
MFDIRCVVDLKRGALNRKGPGLSPEAFRSDLVLLDARRTLFDAK